MGEELTIRAQEVAMAELADLNDRAAHVRRVAAKTAQTTRVLSTTPCEEVVAAAWLHDVGYGARVRESGFHPLDGATFLKEQYFPDLVVSLVAHHSGAFEEAVERGLSEQLSAFDKPPRDLLDVLTFADMTTGPQGQDVDVDSRISEILNRYDASDPVHSAVMRSADSLRGAVNRVQDLLKRAS